MGIKIYEFLNKYASQVSWVDDDLIVWIPLLWVAEFCKLFSYSIFAEGGIDCRLQQHEVALNIIPILDHYGIDPDDILKKEDEIIN